MNTTKGLPQVSGSDHRLVESCLRIMQSQGFQVAQLAQTGHEGAKIIDQFISKQDWDKQRKSEYIQSVLTEAKQNLLPLDELNWFKKDDRACYWVWLTIVRTPFFAAPTPPVFQPAPFIQLQIAASYAQLNLKTEPSGSKERFEEIVKYIDRVCQPLNWQLTLIAYLKHQWGLIFNARKPFSWLKENDEDQCRWAWDYLSKPASIPSRPIVYSLNPTSCSEAYLAIYAAFDTWNTIPDSKRLFLNDFNKAWQQKKHRDSRQGKKVCNIVLREEVKQMLDDMAAARGMKLNQLVETLIENEHANVVNSI